MKQFLLFILLVVNLTFLNAQNNIGIGTNTPHASAQLDISSTKKGLLAPRMTTAERTAIATPAKGLLVYDTDVNSLFHYNGSAWVNFSAGGGGAFSLPYSASVNLNTNVFQITNAGNSAAITGITTNEYGIALSGISSSAYGIGLYGYADAPDAIAVYGYTGSGTAVRGHAVNGVGVDARSTNNSAIKASILLGANANPTIIASHAGVGNAIEGSSNTGSGVKGTTNSTLTSAAGVYGVNNSLNIGYGVLGLANSILGTGVQGNSVSGTGVFGNSTGSGVGLKGKSVTGYGLDVEGKISLSGGNTNPETGAVLTSTNGIGDAVWKPRQIAFKAYGTYSSFIGVTMSSASRKMHFASKQYDYGNNFTTTTSGSPSAGMSTFDVPVDGLYHFDVGIKITLDDTWDDFRAVNAYVIVKRNNADLTILTVSTQCCNANLGYEVSLFGSIDYILKPGDLVRVQIYQWNDDDATAKLTNNLETYFGGHLVFAH